MVISKVRLWILAAAVAVLLNLAAFFSPPKGIAQACSYRAIRHIDRLTRATCTAIESLRRTGPVTLIAYDHQIPWRNFSYYFPDTPLLVLRNDPRNAFTTPDSVWLILGRQRQVSLSTDNILLPDGTRTVWLLSRGRGMHRLLRENLDLTMAETMAYADIKPGAQFRFGRYRFAASGR